MSGYLGSNAVTEKLLAALAAANQSFDINSLIKSEFEENDLTLSTPTDNKAQHGIWNTINQDGLQLLLAQREKHVKQLQKQKTDRELSIDNPGFVYVDVSESSSPGSTQSSTSSMSQPPRSNLSSVSSSSFSSQDAGMTEMALKDALNVTMARAPRAYRWASPTEKDSAKYKAKRERNNEAVRRSREKNKVKKLLEDEKYDQLRKRYNAMLDSMKKCTCGCAAQFLLDHGTNL